jgi:2-polyprenyl-3-methyl-5-hydroxy-6-metoxy-1,4-benzoquinol methylase
MMDKKYIFQTNNERAEYERLRLIEKAFDPYTQAHFNRLGLGPGARCLEIGPGAGSIMRWLCQMVGPEGHVTALDLDTRFIGQEKLSNLTVIQGDLVKEELENNRFDFIHARYVFIHIHDYQEALKKIYQAVKPGGWILLEEPEFTRAKAKTDDEALNQSFMNIHEAIKLMYDAMKLDPAFGGKLERLLKKNGFTNMGSDTVASPSAGGSLVADFMRRSAIHLKEKYLKTGAADEKDIDNYCRLADDPQRSAVYYGSVSSWGQKPLKRIAA